VAGAGGFLAFSEAGLALWIGVVLVVLGIALIALVLTARSEKDQTGQEVRSVRQNEFERTGLDGPDAWTRDAVERHADQVLKRLREAEVAAEKVSEWKRISPDREETEKQAKQLEEERKRIAKDIGLDPETNSDPEVSSRSLAWLVDRLSQWQSAHDNVKELRKAEEEAESTSAGARQELNRLLSQYAQALAHACPLEFPGRQEARAGHCGSAGWDPESQPW